MGSDGSEDRERPSLEVAFGRKKREAKREERVIERFVSRVDEEPVETADASPVPAAIEADTPTPSASLPDEAQERTRTRRTKVAKLRRAPRAPRPPRAPWAVVPASVVTGLVVGLVMVGVGAVALKGCASIRGTASCGGAGLPVLLVIMALGVILGSALLRFLSRAPSATSTSFLAVAFVAVIGGLFLLDAIDGWPAVVIVPVLCVLGYLGSHWVMTHYIEPADETG
ncbi:hypothetical protein [Nocardioides sp. Kera G14]|uniref:hypothetical protein n=1 Tax=Nocardioides sp. Kera G14 TaxID=2884264 RepID=UPI001D0F55C7|nr:hypothetical protein [Nocardioides sp. Kera G14]UDY23727.1 hypothetical protein LH076_00055 [Nocardioides sp. Kera G14]